MESRTEPGFGPGSETVAFEGEYRDGKRHGTGTHTWADGGRYVREWLDGKPHVNRV